MTSSIIGKDLYLNNAYLLSSYIRKNITVDQKIYISGNINIIIIIQDGKNININNNNNGFLFLEDSIESLNYEINNNDILINNNINEIIINFGIGLSYINRNSLYFNNKNGSMYGVPDNINIGNNLKNKLNKVTISGINNTITNVIGSVIINIYNLNKIDSSINLGNLSFYGHLGINYCNNKITNTNINVGKKPNSSIEQDIIVNNYKHLNNDNSDNSHINLVNINIYNINFFLQDNENVILGYPVLFLILYSNNTIMVNNLNIFSKIKQSLSDNGLFYINTLNYNKSNNVCDTFIINTYISARNYAIYDGKALKFDNLDKVTLIQSSITGTFICKSNKLSINNCYFLNVSITDKSKYTNLCIKYYKANNNKTKETGLSEFKTDLRIIITNTMFVSLLKNYNELIQNITNNFLTDIYNNNYFNIYKYNNVEKNVYPFYIETIEQNFNFSNCNFFTFIMYSSKTIYDSINLNNIKHVFIDV